MLGRFPRRNNRKARLSSWFASERDGDLHALDVHGLASSLRVLASAMVRDAARRWRAPRRRRLTRRAD